jgi:hypothetical protein
MMRLTIHLGHLLWQTLQLLGGAPWWKEEIFHGERSPKTWGNNLFYFFPIIFFGKQLVLLFLFYDIPFSARNQMWRKQNDIFWGGFGKGT